MHYCPIVGNKKHTPARCNASTHPSDGSMHASRLRIQEGRERPCRRGRDRRQASVPRHGRLHTGSSALLAKLRTDSILRPSSGCRHASPSGERRSQSRAHSTRAPRSVKLARAHPAEGIARSPSQSHSNLCSGTVSSVWDSGRRCTPPPGSAPRQEGRKRPPRRGRDRHRASVPRHGRLHHGGNTMFRHERRAVALCRCYRFFSMARRPSRRSPAATDT